MENNSQAIELKGIARSLSKLNVQDGQCEDIVNLRLKDGSWRVSDDGKHVYSLPEDYTQLYVHTNVYHHLLGVLNGKLWYFANIENDGETFTPLESPVEICDVQGDVTIVQNGHLLTIICAVDADTTPLPLEGDEKEIKYSIFKTGTNDYQEIKVDPNGKQTDRELYPFGRVNFNLHHNKDKTLYEYEYVRLSTSNVNGTFNGDYNVNKSELLGPLTIDFCRDKAKSLFGKQTKNNMFTRPFLACAAFRLYDGSFAFASTPVLLDPNCMGNKENEIYGHKHTTYVQTKYESGEIFRGEDGQWYESEISRVDTSVFKDNEYVFAPLNNGFSTSGYKYGCTIGVASDLDSSNTTGSYCWYKSVNHPIFNAGSLTHINDSYALHGFAIAGYDLVASITDMSILKINGDIFKSLCIFITPQVDIYSFEEDDYTENDELGIKWVGKYNCCVYYKPKKRLNEDIVRELMDNQFFLLKEYNINQIQGLIDNPIIDLSKTEDVGLLSNLSSQNDKILTSNSVDRKDYIPKAVYSYNQKLHIANYDTRLFKGYPLDLFYLNNHLVNYKKDIFFSGVLPNLEEDTNNQYCQYPRERVHFINANDQEAEQYISMARKIGAYFAFVKVTIETQHGESEVVRYIAPYDAHMFKNGDKANFVEDLSPLLTYPDARAKKMEIKIASLIDQGQAVEWYGKVFELSPHPYLNLAYYIAPNLAPIQISEFDGGYCLLNEYDDYGMNEQFILPKESNSSESFPNGLKVSKVNNPFYFPNATTYQVGSAEIVALMSNAVAVGAGQTGAAPLYVFCKDGIYALLVDSSGELAYTNARIIARDVCNNAKSVTPIDNGVVFTTDRGLMEIAGNEVVELGQIVEGDVFDIVNRTYIDVDGILKEDKAKKIMFNSFTKYQLGALPQGLLDNADFLTFLRGAIVNYNHNERELMISNPNYPYTYVMDRYGNWSRRDYKATEYVNNYPTSYRVDEGKLYKVDTDDGVSTNNGMYLLSQVIKLGTIAFKQAYRLVVRGYFETPGVDHPLGCYCFGSYDGRKWGLLGRNEKGGKFTDIGCNIAHSDVKFLRLCISGQLSKDSRIDFVEIAAEGSVLNAKIR